MDILGEIRDAFAEVEKNSAICLQSLGEENKAWVLKYDDWYGVGVPLNSSAEVSERFSNVRLWTKTMIVDGAENQLLLLTSSIESLRYEFASVCAEFLEPGGSGIERKKIIENPLSWWEKWRTLLGNSVKDKSVYSVLGELLTYEKLIDKGLKPNWAGPNGATHDIELKDSSYEVKSTIKRYDTIITINSQFQLQWIDKDINIIFCRFEESNLGDSINDVVDRLSSKGITREQIDRLLIKMGFELGSSSRLKKYKLLEMRRYKTDESFPAISAKSFKNGKIPDSIIQLTYSIDLAGISYENWMPKDSSLN
jgi:hypothetical protein